MNIKILKIIEEKLIPENNYQEFSKNIIKMNIKDTRWADKQNLINDIVFRLKDAFGIEEYHINELEKKIKELPKRFHNEFVNEVIVDQYSITSINDVYNYYISDIFEELTQKEKNFYRQQYLTINLR